MIKEDFNRVKHHIIDKEISIAVGENHPGLEKIVKKLEDMRNIEDPKTFISKYKRLTGATKYDLPKELRQFIGENNMKKIVKLNENDIEKLVKKIIKEDKVNEAWPQRELDRKASNFRRSDFKPYNREKDVKGLFGVYGEEIPPQVIQYLRKNPAALVKRLVKIYGIDKMYEYIDNSMDEPTDVQENFKLNDLIRGAKGKK